MSGSEVTQLTATVRMVHLNRRQVTRNIYRQLDRLRFGRDTEALMECRSFGRVRSGDVDPRTKKRVWAHEFLAITADGDLVRVQFTWLGWSEFEAAGSPVPWLDPPKLPLIVLGGR